MLLQKFGLLALGALAMGSPMPNGGMNVDDANTRSDWVTKYKPGSMNVDDTNTRSDWVTKYKPGSSPEHAELQHWVGQENYSLLRNMLRCCTRFH